MTERRGYFMKKQNVYRISFYILGLLILAMGLTPEYESGFGGISHHISIL